MSYTIKRFDYSISFENPMSVFVSKLRNKKSILLLDKSDEIEKIVAKKLKK